MPKWPRCRRRFSQNLLKETNAAAVVVDSREQLSGLSDEAIARRQRRREERATSTASS